MSSLPPTFFGRFCSFFPLTTTHYHPVQTNEWIHWTGKNVSENYFPTGLGCRQPAFKWEIKNERLRFHFNEYSISSSGKHGFGKSSSVSSVNYSFLWAQRLWVLLKWVIWWRKVGTMNTRPIQQKNIVVTYNQKKNNKRAFQQKSRGCRLPAFQLFAIVRFVICYSCISIVYVVK